MKLRSAIGSAPGRLDVLGGVSDYSGALVLETPIRAQTRVGIEEIEAPELRFASRTHGEWEIPLAVLPALLELSREQLRAELDSLAAPLWARYLFGCLWVLCLAKAVQPRTGLSIRALESVPVGVGVSSSAALEIAALRALARVMRSRFDGTELARLGQRAENEVVGAPCGLMDQLTSAFGRPGRLLPIRCQPDVLLKHVALPRGVTVVGWNSAAAHSVGGNAYGVARTAAFMGKRILEGLVGSRIGHAADVPPSVLMRHESQIPETIPGGTYLRDFSAVDDPLSRVDPKQSYPVRAALRFASHENRRSRLAVQLLSTQGPRGEDRLREIGELMYQSHEGYRQIGLGHERTDQIVNEVYRLGPENGFYGARSSGGGAGGTVVVLMRKRSAAILRDLAGPENVIPAAT